jgi:hypothetical protein
MFHCHYIGPQILFFSTVLWCPTRLSVWTSSVYFVYHPSQHSTLPLTSWSSSVCRWYPVVHLFSPHSYPSSIGQLQSATGHISSWMSSNQLPLNPKKTEFLVIGSHQQLSKLNHPVLIIEPNTTITPVSCAHNLGVLFDNCLSFDNQITSLSKSCFYHICDMRRIRDIRFQSCFYYHYLSGPLKTRLL